MNSGKTVLHELCHILGVNHMQARYDRDQYIIVHFDKIRKGNQYNFKKDKGGYGKLSRVGLPYDYNSVMHYSSRSFGIEPRDITMTLKKKFSGKIGFTQRLSRTDVATLNRLYGCKDHYLGDDIAGGITYKEWYQTYFP